MKKVSRIIGLMLMLLAFSVPAVYAADNAKTGVVDLTTVINNSEAGKKANADLNELVNAKRAEAQEKGQAVEALKKAFDEQAANLSADDKKAKQEELAKAYNDYQNTVAQSNAEVQKKQADLRNTVLQDIKTVLIKLAQEEQYTVILDAAVVPYYDKTTDITNKVIQKYNEMKK